MARSEGEIFRPLHFYYGAVSIDARIMTTLGSLQSEYSARINRARELMSQQKYDALFLTTGPNLAYFSGMPGSLGGKSGARPYVYILPRDGPPALVVHSGRKFEAETKTPVDDIRTYSELSHLPKTEIQGVFDDRGLNSGKIGCEFGNEMVFDLPIAEFDYFRATSEASFEDASDLLWRLRTRKSKPEIERLQRACDITSEAYEQTFERIESGMTEAEIEARMGRHMLDLGGTSPWVLITSGSGNYDLVSKSGGNRTVKQGDMVWMDCGCAVEGYWSDFSRAGVLGGPTPKQSKAQEVIAEITEAAIDEIHPGVPLREVASFCNDRVDECGLGVTSKISTLASRVGHGVGLNITEPPSIAERSEAVFEQGMAVTVEPGVATDYGTFHAEAILLVRKNGIRRLSPEWWELHTI